MPLFDYECCNCGKITEVLQPEEDPAPECPQCGGATDRCISKSTTFQLKGDGWAKDGYSKS